MYSQRLNQFVTGYRAARNCLPCYVYKESFSMSEQGIPRTALSLVRRPHPTTPIIASCGQYNLGKLRMSAFQLFVFPSIRQAIQRPLQFAFIIECRVLLSHYSCILPVVTAFHLTKPVFPQWKSCDHCGHISTVNYLHVTCCIFCLLELPDQARQF